MSIFMCAPVANVVECKLALWLVHCGSYIVARAPFGAAFQPFMLVTPRGMAIYALDHFAYLASFVIPASAGSQDFKLFEAV